MGKQMEKAWEGRDAREEDRACEAEENGEGQDGGIGVRELPDDEL